MLLQGGEGAARVVPAPGRPLVVTGFLPFAGDAENPSRLVAHALDGTRVLGVPVIGAELPVETGAVAQALAGIWALGPAVLLHLGLAAGRAQVSLERVAVNLLDFAIPDEVGERIEDREIAADGPAAYFSTLPVRRSLHRLRASGIPVHLSLTAGAFLCNQVFYLTQHHYARTEEPTLSGFVHLPYLPSQAAAKGALTASLSLDVMIAAARQVLETSVEAVWAADPVPNADRSV